MNLKKIIRSILIFLRLDLTKNLEYDRLTRKILKKVVKPGTNCIDVGCHKGEILDLMLKSSPHSKHFAFEPIPYLFGNLQKKYAGKATLFPYALSEKKGKTTFQLVKNAPAYSGIKKRRYDIANPEIEEIEVEMRTMDEVIPPEIVIGLIKIDVEGGEFGVLKGAENILRRDKPTVIFECGMGASDYYGTRPNELYDFITTKTGLKINTLKGYLKGNKPLSSAEFENCFNTNSEYYFIAHRT